MKNGAGMSKERAYDQARKEFYELRLQEDIERRVAKEEAMATGAYFGKSMVQVGSEIEDQAYEKWRAWAKKNVMEMNHKRAGAVTGLNNSSTAQSKSDDTQDPEEEKVPSDR